MARESLERRLARSYGRPPHKFPRDAKPVTEAQRASINAAFAACKKQPPAAGSVTPTQPVAG